MNKYDMKSRKSLETLVRNIVKDYTAEYEKRLKEIEKKLNIYDEGTPFKQAEIDFLKVEPKVDLHKAFSVLTPTDKYESKSK